MSAVLFVPVTVFTLAFHAKSNVFLFYISHNSPNSYLFRRDTSSSSRGQPERGGYPNGDHVTCLCVRIHLKL